MAMKKGPFLDDSPFKHVTFHSYVRITPEVTARISTVKIRYGMGVGLLFCMGVMYTDKKALLS